MSSPVAHDVRLTFPQVRPHLGPQWKFFPFAFFFIILLLGVAVIFQFYQRNSLAQKASVLESKVSDIEFAGNFAKQKQDGFDVQRVAASKFRTWLEFRGGSTTRSISDIMNILGPSSGLVAFDLDRAPQQPVLDLKFSFSKQLSGDDGQTLTSNRFSDIISLLERSGYSVSDRRPVSGTDTYVYTAKLLNPSIAILGK